VAGVVVAVAAALGAWMLKPAPARPVTRLVIDVGPEEHLANLNTPAVAISPDGANIAYVASRGNSPAQLFLRPLDALKAQPITGTEGALSPFFAPDGQWIAFFAGGRLKKVVLTGGAAVALCDAGTGITVPGGTWGPNNTILFQSLTGTFLEVSASGGTARRVTVVTKTPAWRWPEMTPNGGAVIFAGGAGGLNFGTNSSIAAATLDGAGAEKDLIAGVSPHLAATGDMIYAQNGTLMAVPFNSKRLELTGSPAPVLEGVRESTMGAAQYGLSASGTLVYVPGTLQGFASRLAWVDRQGKEQAIAAPAHGYTFPRISPDGRRIAVSITETASDLWIYDTERDALSRATFGGTSATPTPSGRPTAGGLRLTPTGRAPR
jgi:serine/threonine-protein kinase